MHGRPKNFGPVRRAMRLTFLIFFLASFLTLSGCLGDDETPQDDADDVPDEGMEEIPQAEVQTYDLSCTAVLGAALVSLETPAGGVGGCNLGAAETKVTYVAEEVPDGCNVQFDADGDGFSDGVTSVGATYEAGTSFVAFCDPGVVDAQVSITLAEAGTVSGTE